jgi:hypothetical protein
MKGFWKVVFLALVIYAITGAGIALYCLKGVL